MFSSMLLVVVCAAVYIIAWLLLWREVHSAEPVKSNVGSLLTAIIVLLHGYLLYRGIFTDNGIHISLGTTISMAGWTSMLMLILITLCGRAISLGLVIFPIGFLAIVFEFASRSNPLDLSLVPEGAGWHIALAIPTYGILSIAFAQACILIYQDRLLHKPNPGDSLVALPAIQTMESNLYWFTLIGFLLMSISLVAGMISNMQTDGSLLAFNHHVLLTAMAWLLFAGLLIARKILGWRGKLAAKWTIAAFVVLALGFFGTRFVNEFILYN